MAPPKSAVLSAAEFAELLSDRNHPAARDFFRFMKQQLSHENVLFWWAVEDFKVLHDQIVDQSIALSCCRDICSSYVRQGAFLEVNIDENTRNSVVRRVDELADDEAPQYDIFDAAQAHVFKMMHMDCVPRYHQYRERQNKDDPLAHVPPGAEPPGPIAIDDPMYAHSFRPDHFATMIPCGVCGETIVKGVLRCTDCQVSAHAQCSREVLEAGVLCPGQVIYARGKGGIGEVFDQQPLPANVSSKAAAVLGSYPVDCPKDAPDKAAYILTRRSFEMPRFRVSKMKPTGSIGAEDDVKSPSVAIGSEASGVDSELSDMSLGDKVGGKILRRRTFDVPWKSGTKRQGSDGSSTHTPDGHLAVKPEFFPAHGDDHPLADGGHSHGGGLRNVRTGSRGEEWIDSPGGHSTGESSGGWGSNFTSFLGIRRRQSTSESVLSADTSTDMERFASSGSVGGNGADGLTLKPMHSTGSVPILQTVLETRLRQPSDDSFRDLENTPGDRSPAMGQEGKLIFSSSTHNRLSPPNSGKLPRHNGLRKSRSLSQLPSALLCPMGMGGMRGDPNVDDVWEDDMGTYVATELPANVSGKAAQILGAFPQEVPTTAPDKAARLLGRKPSVHAPPPLQVPPPGAIKEDPRRVKKMATSPKF